MLGGYKKIEYAHPGDISSFGCVGRNSIVCVASRWIEITPVQSQATELSASCDNTSGMDIYNVKFATRILGAKPFIPTRAVIRLTRMDGSTVIAGTKEMPLRLKSEPVNDKKAVDIVGYAISGENKQFHPPLPQRE